MARSPTVAGRQKLSVTRISKAAAICCALLYGLAVDTTASARGELRFASPEAALEQGMNAYRARHFEIAIPALERAAETGNLFAKFYLARIYSDNTRAYTNHGRAYALYSEIVDGNIQINPADLRRAPTVAKSITAMARYIQSGLPEIDVPANKRYAVRLYRYAAQIYDEPNAQFELAKLQLVGDGVKKDARSALYWFRHLVKRGHAGAQAFLADLYWRGRYVKADRERALRLITVAQRNAPPHERIWIDDIYQNIFCGSDETARLTMQGAVAGWAKPFGLLGRQTTSQGTNWFTGPARTCRDGTPIKMPGARDASRQDGIKTQGNASDRVGHGQASAARATDAKQDAAAVLGLTSSAAR